MAQVIALDEGRKKVQARRAFRLWERRFGGTFDEKTTIRDLPDHVLAALVQTGEAAHVAIQSVILAVLTGEEKANLDNLPPQQKIRVIDRALFLLDRIRFECMQRLGWVEDDEAARVPILELIEAFDERFAHRQNETPALTERHPRYQEFLQTFEADRSSFVRRLIPEAIEAFRARVQSGEKS
ncbi:hypothetical protein SAMN02745206_00398 [Desulfacinum infernum DSM 9756]|uniref:Uncharacterized protein n=1 Tax=Desulfacinum infernum DSM 9756 TaxID=1121391 RepID=A0A1M4TWF5_9BACT|nr:hypothetical protein [Desulfacinum infernum]SHE48815.1 hypothetical protein SAMN02745206_00398 [Desulfacinum infernum DSM 9756]